MVFAAAAIASQAPEAPTPGVIDLTPENFDSVVDGTKHVLVEFYAPWCGHCKHLAEDYGKLGEKVLAARVSDVVIAKVNADAHRDLGSKFGVRGFPTIKFFPKGSKEPIEYNQGRTVDDFLAFISEKTGAKLAPKKAASDVTVLGPENFDQIVMDSNKNALVEFYAPWCGHCKRLAPDYEIVAHAFKSEPNCVVANLDADKHRDLSSRYGVTGFPTLKFFSKDSKEPTAYEGDRSPQAFIDFLNEKCGTFRKIGGGLLPQAGRIATLDDLAAKYLAADSAQREQILKEAEQFIAADKELSTFDYYIRAMKNVNTKGNEWVAKEKTRINKILESGNMQPTKVDEMQIKHNILSMF